MHWKLKSKIQNVVAFLPSSLSFEVYYWIQRHFGGLRKVNPISGIQSGTDIRKKILANNRTFIGKVFFEVGTGRNINVPLSLWLLGAEKVITVDLNPYLKVELVRENINYILENQEEIRFLFKEFNLIEERLIKLLDFNAHPWGLGDLLQLCSIEYIAPCDAASLHLEDNSIDFHISNNVFEHIPPDTLISILEEGNRIMKNEGLFIHRIDFSDHFSHSDKSISSINFLQFSDEKWDELAGNRYMYMNRLRIDDIEKLYQESNHKILSIESSKDLSVYDILKSGHFLLNHRFMHKSEDVIATINAWVVSEKCS